VPDLKDELRRLADDAASHARPLAAAEVIRQGDRRRQRTVSGWRRERSRVPGRRWPGWVPPLAAAAAVTAVIAVAATVSSVTPGSGPAAVHRSTAPIVYVAYPGKYEFSGTLVPVSTATKRPGKPIRIGTLGGLAFTPDGKTAYVEGPTGEVIPISTATGTPGAPIHVRLPGYRPFIITMDPDGKTAYLMFSWHIGSLLSGSIVPISTATNTPGKPIRLATGKTSYVAGIVFSPDGKTAYAAAGSLFPTESTGPLLNPAAVVPINTVTNKPGKPIRVSHGESSITITPDGKTVYVGGGGRNGRPGYVTPINTATSTPGKPVRVSTGAGNMAVTPDGKTLYVAGSDTITPVSTATNTAAQPIRVKAGTGVMVITPDGKTLYTYTDTGGRGTIIPISTASNTAGRPIRVAAEAIAVTPDGKTLYAAARRGGIIPISTAADTPGKVIRLANYRGISSLWITP
jgi:DNA-binding beta-propeller fold protein YncE